MEQQSIGPATQLEITSTASRLCVRRFLDQEESHSTAHLLATVERGEGRFTLADSDRSVTLDFLMETPEDRTHALEKAETFAAVALSFRDAIRAEVRRLNRSM